MTNVEQTKIQGCVSRGQPDTLRNKHGCSNGPRGRYASSASQHKEVMTIAKLEMVSKNVAEGGGTIRQSDEKK